MDKIFRTIALKFQNHYLGFDSLCKNQPSQSSLLPPPIFVIGAPRSGSTLLYQFIIRNFEVDYISNFMALCPKHLLSIANWTKASRLNQDKIKSEKHGYVKGLHAPSEAGALHRFFFETHSDETHKEQVRETFSYLGLSGGQPLLVKNLNNTFRLKRIVEHFPDARFIMITRNKLDAASSLLRARLKEHKSLNCWFGPKPPGFEKFLNYTPAYQVLWQIAEMENIARNFVQEYHCPFYEIELNELISNPGLLKKQIMKFLNLPSKNNQATEGIRPLKSSNINSDWLSDLNTALDELKTAGVRIQS